MQFVGSAERTIGYLYRKAGGRTANYVRLKYESGDRVEDEPGELIFLSAARR